VIAVDPLTITTTASTVVSHTGSGECIDVSIQTIAESQFEERKVAQFSSSFVVKDVGRTKQVRFIKNTHNVVVGEILGDGIRVEFDGTLTGVTLCFNIPRQSIDDYVHVGLAIPDENYEVMYPVENTIVPTPDITAGDHVQICVPLNSTQVYFPIGLENGAYCPQCSLA